MDDHDVTDNERRDKWKEYSWEWEDRYYCEVVFREEQTLEEEKTCLFPTLSRGPISSFIRPSQPSKTCPKERCTMIGYGWKTEGHVAAGVN